ncbi:MAG: amidohydrolase family protein [Gemmatimonadota bacterium]
MNRLNSGICALAVALPVTLSAQPAPIIDMHVHALGVNDQGPAPVAICAPFPGFPAWDQRQPYIEALMGTLKNPSCDDPVWSPTTDDELREETIQVLERLNVYGVLSGPTSRVQAWREAAPERFMAGLGFSLTPSAPSPDSLRALVQSGSLEVLAEVTNQYLGIAPADERMDPYWALAEELDLPVGIHMGPGPPGGIYIGQTAYRARLSSACCWKRSWCGIPGCGCT